jgi:hypothetical protein
MGGPGQSQRCNEYAEAELERLKEDLLDRLDEAGDMPDTGGQDGESLADVCNDENPADETDTSFGFDLAQHLKNTNE